MCFLSFLEKCQVSKTLFNVLLRSTKRSGVDSESLNRRRKKGHTHRLTSTYVDVRVCVMWSRATWYYLCPDTLYLQVWGLSISAFPHVAITHIHSLLLSDFYHVSPGLIVFFSIYPRHCVTVFFPSRSLALFLKVMSDLQKENEISPTTRGTETTLHINRCLCILGTIDFRRLKRDNWMWFLGNDVKMSLTNLIWARWICFLDVERRGYIWVFVSSELN